MRFWEASIKFSLSPTRGFFANESEKIRPNLRPYNHGIAVLLIASGALGNQVRSEEFPGKNFQE